ncbi:MAG: T9SS type A sorting domain-containing protein, partial [candidate division Zixibacteria bacterium]|nr:T9SS type A sorting domain-containing protein [candidate division Zixibacteria bacterium]
PERFGFFDSDDKERIISNRIEAEFPFAVHRVATFLSTNLLFPSEPGNGETPLYIQLSTEQEALVYHPTDFSIAGKSPDGASGTSVEVYPGISFFAGEALYVGLQWTAGYPANPTIGLETDLGVISEQEVGYLGESGAVWIQSTEFYALEVDLLGWKPNSLFATANSSTMQFSLWYSADSLKPASDAFARTEISSLTLTSLFAYQSDGIVGIAALDTTNHLVSDTIYAKLQLDKFPLLNISPEQVELVWIDSSANPEFISISNSDLESVSVRLSSLDSRVKITPSIVIIPGNDGEALVKLELVQRPDLALETPASIIISSDRDWYPVKYDVNLKVNLQTFVGPDEATTPKSFEVSEAYPNPTRGEVLLKIVSPVADEFRIEVFNVLGQLTFSHSEILKGERELSLRLEPSSDLPLATGVYFIRISTRTETQMRKVLLIR